MEPKDQSQRGNRLVHETSPYLLQHAYNPVDWYPWCDEAIDAARASDRPIFLSIGYSACHWCHVMERESFANEEVAVVLNESFVCVKVDREERPDLDEVYMTAVQLMTGSGGWPMTVFLTPKLRPFYCGTYFPPDDRSGRPGLKTLALGIARAWDERRGEVVSTAENITRLVAQEHERRVSEVKPLTDSILAAAENALRDEYDRCEGGFGSAPKFPPHAAVRFLLSRHERTGGGDLLEMATHTLDKMARGGIFDQIGGGFHRYSVDARWLVPHFEKMLYDNALLVPAYLGAYRITGDEGFRRTAILTLDYLLRDARDARGLFCSSENADSDGREGSFYLWTRDEVMSCLGHESGDLFCSYYGVLPEGNFVSPEPYHQGCNILHADIGPREFADRHGIAIDALESGIANVAARLLAVRGNRARPSRDDKVVTSWNALTISAFAEGFNTVGDPRYRDAALTVGEFLFAQGGKNGAALSRIYRDGEGGGPAYLDDHASVVNAFLDLYDMTFDGKWLDAAVRLMDTTVDGFWDGERGGFFLARAGDDKLLVRTRPMYDGAEPSGNSLAALGLLRLGRRVGRFDYFEKASMILGMNVDNMTLLTRGHLAMLRVLGLHLGPLAGE